jgi:hypothetical protein
VTRYSVPVIKFIKILLILSTTKTNEDSNTMTTIVRIVDSKSSALLGQVHLFISAIVALINSLIVPRNLFIVPRNLFMILHLLYAVFVKMAGAVRLELTTCGFGDRCSSQLSYTPV